MGTHTIEFTWNFVLKTSHRIVVTRRGGFFIDILEVRLDGNTIMSRQAGSIWVAQHQFWVDDNLLELRWKWGILGDPESIVLISNNKVIGQYGNNSAAEKKLISEIANNNLIPLITPKKPINFTAMPVNSTSALSSQSFVAEKIALYFQPEIEMVEAAIEQIHIPPEVTITVKRSRTIEHTIDIKWTTSGELNFELGMKQVISASIRGQIEHVRGSSLKESETREDAVELSGGDKGRKYKLVWVDQWRKGLAEVSQGSETWMLPFRFHEESRLEVLPVES